MVFLLQDIKVLDKPYTCLVCLRKQERVRKVGLESYSKRNDLEVDLESQKGTRRFRDVEL